MSDFDFKSATELVVALTALVTAIGVAWSQRRGERRRRRTDETVEKVARAAARHSSSVRDVVDELETTGQFNKLTPRDGGGGAK